MHLASTSKSLQGLIWFVKQKYFAYRAYFLPHLTLNSQQWLEGVPTSLKHKLWDAGIISTEERRGWYRWPAQVHVS